MKDFYEKYVETNDKLIVLKNSNQTFPTHFHSNIEILVVLNEKYEITVNAQKQICDGCYVVFSDSYCLHGYKLIGENTGICRSIIIPISHQNQFKKICGKNKPISGVIYSPKVAKRLYNLVEQNYYIGMPQYTNSALSNIILATISEYLNYKSGDVSSNSSLIIKILEYIDAHFKECISLNSLSQDLGYRPEHISRVFHTYMNRNLKEYINQQRYNELSRLKSESPNSKLCDLIIESGFTSVQSYYRFKNNI